MTIEKTRYISYPEAVFLHIDLMREYGEIRFGVAFPELIESALARPQQAAAYENADLLRQAATLCFGLVKNHPWVGGNKRTTTHITNAFLIANGQELMASIKEVIEFVLAIEADRYQVEEIEIWLRAHVTATGYKPKKETP